jgi:hypothetical protein
MRQMNYLAIRDAVQAADFIGKKRVVKRSWGFSAGKRNVNYSETEEHKIKPHKLRNLRDHECVLVHCEKGFKKRILRPLEPNGKVSALVLTTPIVSALDATFPVRVPWNGFPAVIVHSSIYRLKSLPEYRAAKMGDSQAAKRIANLLVNQNKLGVSADFVVPVIQVDQGHYNAIPVAVAAVLARRMGAKLWLDVCQINKVNHTAANGSARLKHQPIFAGSAPKETCMICDDVVTYGASLANLRGFLAAAGAKVIAATAIGAGYGSTKLAPGHNLIQSLQRRYGNELERYTTSLGFRSECLTTREGYFLGGMRIIERIGPCFAQEVGAANRSRCIGV